MRSPLPEQGKFVRFVQQRKVPASKGLHQTTSIGPVRGAEGARDLGPARMGATPENVGSLDAQRRMSFPPSLCMACPLG